MRLAAKSAAILVVTILLGAVTNAAQAAEEKTNDEPKRSAKTAVVQPGDSLSLIADEHDTTYQRIYFANPNVAHPDVIHPGEKLKIPHEDEKLKKRPLPEDQVVAAPVQPVATYSSAPQPQPAPQPAAPAVSAASGSVWDRLAACESGGNWQINTGNGYYGGLQFSAATWQSVGGTGLPHQHSRDEQIRRGQILQARSGWGQWPACSAKLGLR